MSSKRLSWRSGSSKKDELSQEEGRRNMDIGKKVFKKKRGWKFFLLIGVISIFLVFLLWLFYGSNFSSKYEFAKNPIKAVFSGSTLRSDDDRVNILLLGNAGGDHDGPYLTDSIIVASYHLKSKKATLISIPRDMWLGDLRAKVNTAYEIGEKRDKGEGLEFAKDEIDNVLGIPIHYGVRIDFRGFAKAIDLLGGIDVEVPKTFDDYNYPIAGKEDDLCGLQEKEVELSEEEAKKLSLKTGKQKVLIDDSGKIATEAASFKCRYERIHFDQGISHMDGKTALKFVRSRMGTNGEGSDFARSRRQQAVIQAFKDKALSAETIFSVNKIGGLLETFGESVETDIRAENYLELYKMSKEVKSIRSVVLGDLGEGKSLFINPPPSQYGSWVLVPQEEDWGLVADYVRKVLQEEIQ